eukprot:TRINITY_DN30733_c1_g3_i1.p1 TRINITY_DN30733_c1_g3~~TRINITY_DN30733_c1_g3_i1.p1  ORF type:complete len:1888 (+),score=552.35 TRINITY_DN30733_c1_g3_i1:213-5876(+)
MPSSGKAQRASQAPAAAVKAEVKAEAAAATAEERTGSAEAQRILSKDLPQAIAAFLKAYGKAKEPKDLLRVVAASEPAPQLCRVMRHLRDASWRQMLSDRQLAPLAKICEGVLPAMQHVLELTATLELRALLAEDEALPSPQQTSEETSVTKQFLHAALVGAEVSAAYCALVSAFGVPVSLVVEEMSVAVVKLLKRSVQMVAVPFLAAPQDTGLGSSRTSSEARVLAAAVGAHPEAAKACVAGLGTTMRALHELLSRHRLPDELLHQLVQVAFGCFVLAEPDFSLTNGAEELLVTIFARHEALRSSMLQDFFVKVPQLPTGRRSAKKFHLPVAQDSPDYGLTTWTHLLLRLVQSSCLPLREAIGGDCEFAAVLSSRAAGQACLSQLTSGLIQRLVLTRTRDDELRAVFDDLVEEVLAVVYKPMWPGALAWIRSIVHHLVALLQPDKKKVAVEVNARDFGLKVLSKILARLYQHHSEVKRSCMKIPKWDEPPEKVARLWQDERTLQHIALRVSLEEGRDMPWTEAAKAMEAWDAELFLSHGDEDKAGLAALSEEYVFRYLTLAHLEDERFVQAKVPPRSGPMEPLNACTFAAGHPVHAWSFLVSDWAESAAAAKRQRMRSADAAEADQAAAAAAAEATTASASRPGRAKGRGRSGSSGGIAAGSLMTDAEGTLEKFLAYAWTSPTPLYGEGTSWRTGGGRRLLLPFCVYKVYRQLRSNELEGLRKVAFDCLVMQANSQQASLRKTAVRGLSDIIEADAGMLSAELVEQTIEMRLQDESSLVRQVSLDLLGRILEAGMEAGDKDVGGEIRMFSSDHLGQNAPAKDMLLRFHQTVRGRINDTSVLVRRQASKMLSAFVLNYPEHPDVEEVALDLLRRSTDSELLRSLVVGTFELLWFADDEPTQKQAQQLSRVVDASRAMSVGPADILTELLERFRKSIGSRKHGKGFEHAVRRWTTVLLHEFVKTDGIAAKSAAAGKRRLLVKGVTGASGLTKAQSDAWIQKKALLSTLEAFAVAQPREMVIHLRPLTVYLALEDDSSQDEQWVASKVCQIISAVVPYALERRGLMDHKQVQEDLQVLIKNQPASGVHEAVKCLCVVVKYVTGDLGQLLIHLNEAVPALSHLCQLGEQRLDSLQRVQQIYMSRQAWILSSVLEVLSIDEYVEKASIGGGSGAKEHPRHIPLAALQFDLVTGSVAATVADLLIRLYALGEPKLQTVVLTCLGFFLRGQRGYVKEKRICDIFGHAVAATAGLSLRLKVLETLSGLLGHFGMQAEKEVKTASSASLAKGIDGSATQAAQPLAAYSDQVLAMITVGSSSARGDAQAGGEDELGAEMLARIRAEALAVVRLLHQQGLVNPMVVLPKVFALCFVSDPVLSEPAGSMLKDMLDLRPTLLLNRMDEAFRQAFHAAVLTGRGISPSTSTGRAGDLLALASAIGDAPQQMAAICEVYAERFRKQKGPREAFIRRALREICRMHTGRFKEQFAELLSDLPTALGKAAAKVEKAATGEPPAKKARKASARTAKVVDVVGDSDEEEPANGAGSEALRAGELAAFVNALSALTDIQRCQVLFAQFVAASLSALPFAYESEPLLLVFECNRHLSLHAGAMAASFEKSSEVMDVDDGDAAAIEQLVADELFGGGGGGAAPKAGQHSKGAIVASSSSSSGVKPPVQDAGHDEVAASPAAAAPDPFGEALSILTCIVLKGAMKAEYMLSPDQCAQFNPKEVRQERLKNGALAVQALVGKGDEAQPPASASSSRSRFPVEDFRRLTIPLMKASRKPAALASYIRGLADSDPWDTSASRYSAALDRLEGRAQPAPKRGRAGAAAKAGRGAAGRRGRGAGRGAAKKAKAAPKRKAPRQKKVVDSDAEDEEEEDDDEDDEDYEGDDGEASE